MSEICVEHGHRFEPRYDEGREQAKVDYPSMTAVFVPYKRYVCDVCVTCGKVIRRTESEVAG